MRKTKGKFQVPENSANIVIDIFANVRKVDHMTGKKMLTRDEVIEIMRKRQGTRTSKELAEELGINPSYLSDIYAGNREPGDRVLAALGLIKLVLYEKAS